MHNLKKFKYKIFPKKLYTVYPKNFIYRRNFTNKVRVCHARRPALPDPKQDPDPESDAESDAESELNLAQKSDPESDPKQIIPNPQPCF